MSAFLSEKTVTARKPHPCSTCGAGAIEPGQKYSRQSYVMDGSAYTWIQCAPCNALRNIVYSWAWADDTGIGAEEYAGWADEAAWDETHGEDARAYLTRIGRDIPERPTNRKETS